jgi:secondary thiamine-phosphate synthase enzyme
VNTRMSGIRSVAPDLLASAELTVDSKGEGFTDITGEAARFLEECRAGEGALLLYLRHTSAALIIQENADPDVQTDLITALRSIAPADGPWVHTVEGPDDMPGHIKSVLIGPSLSLPVSDGALALGTWQGIYLVEHRTRSHRRDVMLQFVGSRAV